MSRGFTAGQGQEVPSTDRSGQTVVIRYYSIHLQKHPTNLCCRSSQFVKNVLFVHCSFSLVFTLTAFKWLKFTSALCVRSYMMSRDDSIHKHMHAFVFITLFNVEVDPFTEHLELPCQYKINRYKEQRLHYYMKIRGISLKKSNFVTFQAIFTISKTVKGIFYRKCKLCAHKQ